MTVRLGVVADSPYVRYAIQSALADSGFNVSFPKEAHGSLQQGNIDIWLLVAAETNQHVLSSFDYQKVPVLILDEAVPSVANSEFSVWKERLSAKLLTALTQRRETDCEAPARCLWLLAASTGGLDAVVKFLKQIPRSTVGLGFVYAQHIELQQTRHLVDVIERATAWSAKVVADGDYLSEGRVSIISPGFETEIGKGGRIRMLGHPWQGPHKPAIDHIAADVARQYGANSGMIVFTGMGDDGAKGSRFISRSGGQVWVQSPDSCVAASMPEAVLGRGRSNGLADVASLAEKFNQYCLRSLPV